ncbi:YceD family protein [Georgenia deserti]|uniref:YceD family protein n=1 Tax=Georgenia deserti TaxID=2093781 RepID=A0ABW4L462_9MICO
MDARSPLVVNTHELGRRPGASRALERTVPAPADLGTEVIAVPEGSDIELDLRLDSVLDGVFVSGTARARTHGECVRCLQELHGEVEAEMSELYYYPDTRATLIEEGDEEAEELPVVEDEHLDLEPVLRDAVVPALPFQPLCRPDCPGLCAGCGQRWDELEPDHHHEQLDPRWAALTALLEDDQTPDEEEGR